MSRAKQVAAPPAPGLRRRRALYGAGRTKSAGTTSVTFFGGGACQPRAAAWPAGTNREPTESRPRNYHLGTANLPFGYREGTAPGILGGMELIHRNITDRARELLEATPCTVIQGARQVGKSTLAQQLGAGASATYTMDDPDVREAASADPRTFLDQHADELLVIDEIQRAPELILPIKAAIDRDRRPGRFLLTGSSDLLRLQGAPDSLAGRALTLPLAGFSQGELRGHRDDFAARIRDGADLGAIRTGLTRADIVAVMTTGGYPEVQHLGRVRRDWFTNYIDRVLRVDATDIRRVADDSRLAAIARLLAANQSGELVKARIARAAGVPQTSLTRSLDVLDALYLTLSLPPWTPNLTAREASKPKLMIADSGLAAALTRTSERTLLDPIRGSYLGPLLEGFVVAELAKQRSWSAERFELFHWRDRDGREVDVVLEFDDGGVLALEVESTATPRGAHFTGLRALAERLGDRFLGGFVLSLTPRALSFGDGLWALPVSTLWEL